MWREKTKHLDTFKEWSHLLKHLFKDPQWTPAHLCDTGTLYPALLWESSLQRYTGVSPRPQLSGQHSLWEVPQWDLASATACHLPRESKWVQHDLDDGFHLTCQTPAVCKPIHSALWEVIQQGLMGAEIIWGSFKFCLGVQGGRRNSVLPSFSKYLRWFWHKWSLEHTE